MNNTTILQLPGAWEIRNKVSNLFAVSSAYIYMVSSFSQKGGKYEYVPVIKNMLKNWKYFKQAIKDIDKKSKSIYNFVDEVLTLIRSRGMYGLNDSHWIGTIFSSEKCNCMCGTIFVCLCLSMSKKYNLGDKGLHVCYIPGHIYLRWGKCKGDVETTLYSEKKVKLESKCSFTIPKDHIVSCSKVTNLFDVLLLYSWWIDTKGIPDLQEVVDKLRMRLFTISSRSLFMLLVVIHLNKLTLTIPKYYQLLSYLHDFLHDKNQSVFIAWLDMISSLFENISSVLRYQVINKIILIEDAIKLIQFALDIFSPMCNIQITSKFESSFNLFRNKFLHFRDLRDNGFGTINAFASPYIYNNNQVYFNGRPLKDLSSENSKDDHVDIDSFTNYYDQFKGNTEDETYYFISYQDYIKKHKCDMDSETDD
jgi:hypothetical protein